MTPDSDSLISVFEGGRVQAESLASVLRGHGIEVAVFGGLESTLEGWGGARVMVRGGDVAAAREILEEVS